MLVFVRNRHKQPLMPCSPMKARKLLRDKKARVVINQPFTIQLLYGSSGHKQEVVAGMDTGSKVIGTAAVANGNVLYQAETLLRGEEIHKKMEQRRMYRRTRRGRKTRYRAPRFLNRGASTRKERLAPSVKHKVDAHLREKKHLESLLPVSHWRVETASFDIHKISNPTIKNQPGVAYQEGALKGFYNNKAYVLRRDNYTCQRCKKRKANLVLHVHHIVFKSKGGADAPNNLITLCKCCHEKLHKSPSAVSDSLKLQKTVQKKTKHATEVSILTSQLRKRFGQFSETFGYITKFDRETLGLPKMHYIDALCIAARGHKMACSGYYYVRKLVSKGDYQQTKGARSEKKMPTGKLFGIRKFDLIKTAKGVGFVKGKRTSGYFSICNIFGKAIHNSVNVKTSCQRLIARTSVMTGMEPALA
jgi:hypothetical protein